MRVMCIVLVAYGLDPDFPLVVLANRDETFARPAAAAASWTDHDDVHGGRDLEKGGGWLLVSRSRRLACVTNVRVPGAKKDGRSRGELVVRGVTAQVSAEEHARSSPLAEYPAHNALYFDGASLVYANDEGHVRVLEPGIFGLSNARLDTPWPKVERGKRDLAAWLAGPRSLDDAFAILADRTIAEDGSLPSTGVGLEVERALSSVFIHALAGAGYGTRASTVVRVRRSCVELVERSYGVRGEVSGEVRLTLG
ncbi:MAG: NRDE family protein [Polyangiaceae bacterium]